MDQNGGALRRKGAPVGSLSRTVCTWDRTIGFTPLGCRFPHARADSWLGFTAEMARPAPDSAFPALTDSRNSISHPDFTGHFVVLDVLANLQILGGEVRLSLPAVRRHASTCRLIVTSNHVLALNLYGQFNGSRGSAPDYGADQQFHHSAASMRGIYLAAISRSARADRPGRLPGARVEALRRGGVRCRAGMCLAATGRSWVTT
mgnify:CR=1 FL=1